MKPRDYARALPSGGALAITGSGDPGARARGHGERARVEIPMGSLAAPLEVERARVRVTRALRSTLDRIELAHPPLGRHLRSTVRTGRSCAHEPDPRLPVEWGW